MVKENRGILNLNKETVDDLTHRESQQLHGGTAAVSIVVVSVAFSIYATCSGDTNVLNAEIEGIKKAITTK